MHRAVLAVVVWVLGCGHASEPPPDGGPHACAEGFARADQAGCAPILAEPACPEGAMLALGQTTCLRVGVHTCGEGFVADGSGGCNAVLPAPCAPGLMAVPGDATCHLPSPCGAATFGDEPLPATTVYVDGASTGPHDGSRDTPFLTIEEALAKAPLGGTVAIAAGTYSESLVVSRAVRLWGRCASKVEIRGTLETRGAALEVHRVAITGPTHGIYAEGAQVLVSEAWIHDTAWRGIDALARGKTRAVLTVERTLVEATGDEGIGLFGADATVVASVLRGTQKTAISVEIGKVSKQVSVLHLSGSVIESARGTGLSVYGAEATIARSVVRATRPMPDGTLGGGILAYPSSAPALPPALTVEQTLVDKNAYLAIFAVGGSLTVDSVTIRDTRPQASDKHFGRGISVRPYPDPVLPVTVAIRDTLVERSSDMGIALFGASASVAGCLVRDTQAAAASGDYGHGISAEVDPATKTPTQLTLQGSLLLRNRSTGLFLNGSVGEVEGTMVAETLAELADGTVGCGILVQFEPNSKTPSTLLLTSSIVEANHEAGVLVAGSSATLRRSVLRRTKPKANGLFGDGVAVIDFFAPTSVSLEDVVASDNARCGVAVFGARVRVARTTLRCNGFDLDVESFEGKAPEVVDEGENVCGCGEVGPCQAQSARLAPIDVPGSGG